MKEYKYGKGIISPGLSGKTGPIVMFLTVLVWMFLDIAKNRSLYFSLVFAVAYGIFIFGFSWWPIIKCDKESLYLEFLGWPIKIPWENILSVQEIRYFPQKAWLVTAKKITPLHYLYSLLLSFKLVPGFVIWESISNRGELLSHIRRNIKTS